MAQIILIPKPPSVEEEREARIIYLQNLSLPNLIQAPLQVLLWLKSQIMNYEDLRLADFSSFLKRQIHIKKIMRLTSKQIGPMSYEQVNHLIAHMQQLKEQRLRLRIVNLQRYVDAKVKYQNWNIKSNNGNWWSKLVSLFKKSQHPQYQPLQGNRVETIEELLSGYQEIQPLDQNQKYKGTKND